VAIHACHAGGNSARDVPDSLGTAGEVEQDFRFAHVSECGIVGKGNRHGRTLREDGRFAKATGAGIVYFFAVSLIEGKDEFQES
jgi:hypothetical protein